MTDHLNDFFYIAYWHDPEDGFVNLDEADGGDNAETASTESVVKKNIAEEDAQPVALILESVSTTITKPLLVTDTSIRRSASSQS